jgi:hypothetical protein
MIGDPGRSPGSCKADAIKRTAGSGTETITSQFYRLSTSEHINRIGSIIVRQGERETFNDLEKS